MHLMSCTMVKWDNSHIIFSNALLQSMPIFNVTRSDNMEEGHYWTVDWTHAAKKQDILPELRRLIRAETAKSPEDFPDGDPYSKAPPFPIAAVVACQVACQIVADESYFKKRATSPFNDAVSCASLASDLAHIMFARVDSLCIRLLFGLR